MVGVRVENFTAFQQNLRKPLRVKVIKPDNHNGAYHLRVPRLIWFGGLSLHDLLRRPAFSGPNRHLGPLSLVQDVGSPRLPGLLHWRPLPR